MTAPGAAAANPIAWCGTAAAADRADMIASHLVHVVYAVPADGQDRFSTVASGIATDLSEVSSWWLTQDPTRQPRWDFFPFPSCAPGFGDLDISSVRLAQPGVYYQGDGDWGGIARRIENDLASVLPGDTSAKKYLVYYDGAVDTGACGVAPIAPTRGGAQSAAITLMNRQGGCGTLGAANYLAIAAAHELIHSLGAVLTAAPHRCADSGHVCDDPTDIMYAGAGSVSTLLTSRILDVGRDDYYGHSGSWWDVQDSLWLLQIGAEQSQITVRMEGGGGRVTSDPAGIDCAAECSFLFNHDATVTLRALAPAGMRFRRWEGACTGSSSACNVTLDASKTVVARFAPPNQLPTASFSVTGSKHPLREIGFTSQSSDDSSIADTVWYLGDGTIATGPNVTHAYARAGAYTVRLTVVDDEAAQTSVEQIITILDDPPAATAAARSARRRALVRLSYRATDDVDLRQAQIQILSRSRVITSMTRQIYGASYSGSFAWRAPKHRATLRWCIRVSDSAGQASPRSCAPLRVR
jgi:hypothetical protein